MQNVPPIGRHGGGAIRGAGKLPPGRHGLTRGAVIDHQRQRLIRAVPVAVRAKGFHRVTVEDICLGAGVSRRTFYENFRDNQDCFVASYRQHGEELASLVASAAAGGEGWREQARLGIAALLRFLVEHPDVAHMAVIDVMAAGPAALAERDRAVALLASLIGDRALTGPDPAPRLVLRTIAGGILQLIYAWVLAGRTAQLEHLLPTIMYIVLVPLDGPSGAAAEAGLSERARTGTDRA